MNVDTENQTVLVVDDNPLNRELIVAAVESSACRCVQAENGREALEKVKAQAFSLIFMDLLMPGMDGFETVRHIRAMGVATPIVALSALSMKQDKERALAMGCNAFVSKPIDFQTLKDIITGQLARDTDGGISAPGAIRTAARPTFDFSQYRMLVVEEDRKRAAVHMRTMRHFGFSLQHIATCSQALDLLRADPAAVDIIVSNLYTSGIDAMGLLAMVRRQYPDVLVFIYTQKYDPDTYQLAMQQGADGIFPESILDGPAIGMIESALYRRQHESAICGAKLSGQLRQAHARLIGSECQASCRSCDIDFKSLHDAGSDIVCCRKFNRAGRCGFVLADIAGHDLPSLYMGAVFLGILTSCWSAYQHPTGLLRVINAEFIKLGYTKSHVCVSAMLWDGPRRTMHIATAGNPGALLYERAADGQFSCRELDGGGMCLGLLPDHDLICASTVICPAESYIFMFSAGVKKEAIQSAIAVDPALLHGASAKGLCRRILKHEVLDRQDDTVLLAYYMPQPEKPVAPCFSFLSGYDGIDRACAWAAGVLTAEGVPPGKDADFILLALREAMLNAVEHGNRRNPNAFVDVAIHGMPQRLVIEVSDGGPGFELEQALAAAIQESPLGKRGLPAIRGLADSLVVEGGTVTMVFNEK
jgi:CheY-like chemotaxis protein/anti-sigma regulatory factor (Ser/Thr protein kinase)